MCKRIRIATWSISRIDASHVRLEAELLATTHKSNTLASGTPSLAWEPHITLVVESEQVRSRFPVRSVLAKTAIECTQSLHVVEV